MGELPREPMRWGVWIGVLAALLAAAGGGVALYFSVSSVPPPPPARPAAVVETGDVTDKVHRFCAACHAYPPPETFPRFAWKDEVERGFIFFRESGMTLEAPPIDAVVKHYEDRAPEKLPLPNLEPAATPPPVRFERVDLPGLPELSPPAISNVNLVHLADDRRLDVLACEMRHGRILALRPYEPTPTWQILGKVKNPAHTEVIDLDGDGIKDILVADLGSFMPTDQRTGSVVWLRGNRDGTFTPHTLLEGVGRVADVQAADFRGVGKLDLVVAEFGWQTAGKIIYLENQTTDWNQPRFVPRTLDPRHGGIHVPIADLNGDGKPDFVALISQEHETIVAFLNEGNGQFRKETIWTAPHPAYGSSGIQLVDMNGDGELDVVYTNGDTLDKPYLLKPYHSVQWLENPGRGKFPFKHHPVGVMYGVHRAVAADFTGTGRKDIVAVNFLPGEFFPQRKEMNLDSVLYLEQQGPERFARHPLETVSCDHTTCAVGDIFGTGRMDIVTAAFSYETKLPSVLTIWKNMGPRPAP
jgi:hypothetical protein